MTDADIWGQTSLSARFARIADSCADLAAVIDPAGRSWTYRELHRRADRVAALLHRYGVGHGAYVATAFDRSPEGIAAILGIVKLGAVYVPLDSRLPAGRLEFILHDTVPAVILAGRFGRKFSTGAIPVVALDDALPADVDYPESPLDPEAPAYVMYTSGSTGQPKGVIIPHRAILSLVEHWPFFPLGPGNRSLVYSPTAFDSSTFEIWGSLLTGGACVVLEGVGVPALIELRRVIETHAVNWLFFTPALFNLIIDGDPDLFAGVRSVVVGGEAMSVRHARQAKSLFPGLQIINGYGPTETTVFSNCWEVPADLPADTSRIPIGPPLPHATSHLVRSDGALAEAGETAELWIGGDGVGLGYLNREELTAEKFVADEFSGNRARRLYRTGDFARRLPDGSVDFLGRMDGQIKLRGLRIEIGDIECAVEDHPTVGKCVVKLFGEPDRRYLAGFYTRLNAEACSESELREFLQSRLPDYMIPRHLVPLERLPLTVNGKVDRDALHLPAAINSGPSEDATDNEQTLINIFSEILRTRDVARDSCFFEMGGTSLDAVQLCIMVERDLDFRVCGIL